MCVCPNTPPFNEDDDHIGLVVSPFQKDLLANYICNDYILRYWELEFQHINFVRMTIQPIIIIINIYWIPALCQVLRITV